MSNPIFRAIGIYVNGQRDEGYRRTIDAIKFLRSRGMEPLLLGDGDTLKKGSLDLPVGAPGDVDCVVVLGGDGTLLNVAHMPKFYKIPLMGINFGNIGYLTDAPAEQANEALARLLAGEYTLDKRIMLEADLGKQRPTALNDAFVCYSGAMRILTIKVEINGELMDSYRADGILISTPTGSTAYNLSAGGPIIKPDMDILAVTPVCPHALHVRSAVISGSDVVTIHVLSEGGGTLFMDGLTKFDIPQNGHVHIRRASHYATIIQTRKRGFYDVLREKLWA